VNVVDDVHGVKVGEPTTRRQGLGPLPTPFESLFHERDVGRLASTDLKL